MAANEAVNKGGETNRPGKRADATRQLGGDRCGRHDQRGV